MGNSLLVERHGDVLELIMNRPERLNALDFGLIDALKHELGRAKEVGARAVLLRGAGKAFSSGGDVKLFAEAVRSGGTITAEAPDRLHEMIIAVTETPLPVLAVVHGACAGAGFSLTMACDLVIAADDAKFNLAYVGIGLSPDGSSTHFLPRHVGKKKAAELLLGAQTLSAAEALELGLVNRLARADELLEQGRQFATLLAMGPTAAYARVKQLLRASDTNDLRSQLELESKMVVESAGTVDFREGVLAFVEKRPPVFSGR